MLARLSACTPLTSLGGWAGLLSVGPSKFDENRSGVVCCRAQCLETQRLTRFISHGVLGASFGSVPIDNPQRSGLSLAVHQFCTGTIGCAAGTVASLRLGLGASRYRCCCCCWCCCCCCGGCRSRGGWLSWHLVLFKGIRRSVSTSAQRHCCDGAG